VADESKKLGSERRYSEKESKSTREGGFTKKKRSWEIGGGKIECSQGGKTKRSLARFGERTRMQLLQDL